MPKSLYNSVEVPFQNFIVFFSFSFGWKMGGRIQFIFKNIFLLSRFRDGDYNRYQLYQALFVSVCWGEEGINMCMCGEDCICVREGIHACVCVCVVRVHTYVCGERHACM